MRPEVPGQKAYLTIPQLQARWGGCSHMFIERLARTDPAFPKFYRFGPRGRTRFVDLGEIEQYERRSVVKRDVA